MLAVRLLPVIAFIWLTACSGSNGVPVNHIARIHADGSLASVVN